MYICGIDKTLSTNKHEQQHGESQALSLVHVGFYAEKTDDCFHELFNAVLSNCST